MSLSCASYEKKQKQLKIILNHSSQTTPSFFPKFFPSPKHLPPDSSLHDRAQDASKNTEYPPFLFRFHPSDATGTSACFVNVLFLFLKYKQNSFNINKSFHSIK